MSKLSEFYSSFLNTAREQESNDSEAFRYQFNNALEYRTARNCRPRTTLMLGSGGKRRLGLVPQAIMSSWPDIDDSLLSYDRYMDVVAFDGEWWEGKCVARLVVEIENDMREFKGTVSDLLRYQALLKVAVFFDSEAVLKKKQLQDQTMAVFNHFDQHGFCEAADTEYLLVFGPSELVSPGIGEWCAMRFTHGTTEDVSWLRS